MTDTARVTTFQPMTAPAPPAKKRRGRESAGDMIRSLGLVLIIAVALWFFAQPPKSDAQKVRAVDPTAEIRDFARSAPGAPVPHTPAGYLANVSALDRGGLRVGYVTPARRFAEIAETSGPAAPFVASQSAHGAAAGTVDVGGTSWQQLRSDDGHLSLVRMFGSVTVVVGGLRANATLAELQTLAASVR